MILETSGPNFSPAFVELTVNEDVKRETETTNNDCSVSVRL